jgi:hypothetical protein
VSAWLLLQSAGAARAQSNGAARAQSNMASNDPTVPALLPAQAGAKLLAAYPDFIERVDGSTLIWRDGTRTALDDSGATKPVPAWLARPDLKDMFRYPYPVGTPAAPPGLDVDPGRARNAAFFAKMYGDCKHGGVARHLVDVAWLPSRSSVKLKVTTINGVAAQLAAISAELDLLPASFNAYLLPPAGTYVCRPIAGTEQTSAHSYGIAIDIAAKSAHYWRWSKPDLGGSAVWRNTVPMEIVTIFEQHGFIWGGRWHHYDTMHFEYRPELLLQ